MKDTVRLNFDLPAEYHLLLKVLCAKRKITVKKYLTDLIAKKVSYSYVFITASQSPFKENEKLVDDK